MKIINNISPAADMQTLWRNYLENLREYLVAQIGDDYCWAQIEESFVPLPKKDEGYDTDQDQDVIYFFSSREKVNPQQKSNGKEFGFDLRFDTFQKRKSAKGGFYFSFDVNEKSKYVRISKIEFDILILEDKKLIEQLRNFLTTGSLIDEYYFLDNPKILHLHEAENM